MRLVFRMLQQRNQARQRAVNIVNTLLFLEIETHFISVPNIALRWSGGTW